MVDDGSQDNSAMIARQFGARVVEGNGRQGPAGARNQGAGIATGRYLFFTDSDCQLHPDTLSQMAHLLQTNPQLRAAIGSYDSAPAGTNPISRYKNLFHHYIHQTSQPQATTFWAGCGAIERQTFLALGGFNARRYTRPAVEDIELGWRLRRQGGQIRLAPQIQIKHLKKWTLLSLLKSDILDRAIPWSQLLLEQNALPADLNLQWSHRLSAMAVWGLLVAIGGRYRYPAGILTLFLLLANHNLYYLFYRHHGPQFTLQAMLLHWLYYLYSSLAFLWVVISKICFRKPV